MASNQDEYADDIVQAQINELDRFLTPESLVLEVGCGYGRMASLVAARCLRYVGVDFSEVAIAEAETNNPGLIFTARDIFDLPPSQYDLIFMVGVWSSVEERSQELIAKLRTMLSPGGRILVFEDGFMLTVYP